MQGYSIGEGTFENLPHFLFPLYTVAIPGQAIHLEACQTRVIESRKLPNRGPGPGQCLRLVWACLLPLISAKRSYHDGWSVGA